MSSIVQTTRRRFLIISFLAMLWSGVSRLWSQEKLSDELIEPMKLWVETLLPTDDVSPGAGQLGVHLEILERTKHDKRARTFFKNAVTWMEQEAKAAGSTRFADLSAVEAEQIVAKAAAMEPKTLPRLLFNYTLREAKKFYYAKPESWVGLGVERPPQPFGYMNYTEEVE